MTSKKKQKKTIVKYFYISLLDIIKIISVAKLGHGNKNTGIPSIKIPFNIARRNHFFDSHCILTVMIPEMMARAICCKKSFWINRNRSTCVFKLMDFPEFAIKHKSQWEFQLITSEILGHHNQG